MDIFGILKKSIWVIIFCLVLCAVGMLSGCNENSDLKPTDSESVSTPMSSPLQNTVEFETEKPSVSTGLPVSSDSVSDGENTSAPIETPAVTKNPVATPGFIADGMVFFNKTSGFYSSKLVAVSLSAAEGHDIYYTVDCSDPRTSETAIKYERTYKFTDKSGTDGKSDAVTVIKAVSVKKGTKPVGTEQIYTNTYIVNSSVKNFSERYGELGVFSISLDNDLLFGADGIYTNYTEHGRETERMASIEFFEAGGKCEISMDAGIRIYGGTSRALPQKSLKIVARKEYSENGKFKHAFFPDNKDKDGNLIKKYDSFVLRSGGNDSLLSGDRSTSIRDALAHKLAKNIENVSSQDARPVVVYLNGQYWGIYFMREDLDNDYVESHYAVAKENVSIISYGHENGQWFYKVDEGSDADVKHYRDTLSYIATHDMSKAKYYKEASSRLDMDGFIKYMCINIYLNNRDWPTNNVRMWRYVGSYDSSNSCTDGKWRFMLKDIDYSMGRYLTGNGAEDVTESMTQHNINVISGREGEISAALAALLKNPKFKLEFERVMNEIMNEYYSDTKALDQIDKFVSLVSGEMQYHMTCTWGSRGKIPLNKTKWMSNVNILKNYFRKRDSHIQNLIKTYL